MASAPSAEGYAPGWLEVEKSLGARPILIGTPEELTAQFAALGGMLAALSPPPDASVQTRDDIAGDVSVRIYTPEAATGKKLPVGVYYHGGGWVLGNLDAEDAWCRYIAKHTPAIVVSVDYRLAPKYKMPVMLEDSLTAYKWVYKNADSLGGDASKVFAIGASAGGGLALTVCDQLIKLGLRSQIQGVVAMVPVTAHPISVPSQCSSQYTAYTDNASGVPMIDASTMKTFFDAAAVDYHSEKVFVTLSQDLKEFPSTYIATCGKDPLRDDGKVLELLLKAAGVKTKSDFYEGVPHYFWMMPGVARGEEFLANVVKGAQWALGQ